MSDERLISAARGADEVTDWEAAIESKNDFKKRKKQERQNNWKAKMLHGQFIRQTLITRRTLAQVPKETTMHRPKRLWKSAQV